MAAWPLTLLTTLLSLGSAEAVFARMPVQTAIGLMDARGMSPRPTDAPFAPQFVPRDLDKRASTTLTYPAPDFFCGLVNGDADNPITCVNAAAQCVHSYQYVGCCTETDISRCTNMVSTCVGFGQSCGAACQNNYATLNCGTINTAPYCATYLFGNGASTLFACDSLASQTSTVEFLDDYFSSVYGPSYWTRASSTTETNLPSIQSGASSTDSAAANSAGSKTATSGGQTASAKAANQQTGSSKGLSGGAIAGIAIGCAAVAAAFIAFLIWVFCVKRRKNNKQVPQTPQSPPVAQQQSPYGPGPYPPQPQAPVGYFTPENKPPYMAPEPPHYHQEHGAYAPAPGLDVAGDPSKQQYQAVPANAPSEIDGTSRVSSPNLHPSSPRFSAATTATAPNGGYHQAGPVPEQIYEMPSGR